MTPEEKKKGFYIDRACASRVSIGENFDCASMFESLSRISSTDAWKTVNKYLEGTKNPVTKTAALDLDAEIACKLKNIGLTDESIKWVLSVPKTTLRRHVEKSGMVWGFSDKQPFLFKKVKASERGEFLKTSADNAPNQSP